MARTFSPCSDIQTRKMIWAMYNNGKYLGYSSSTLIAGSFRDKYSVEMEDWRKSHK